MTTHDDWYLKSVRVFGGRRVCHDIGEYDLPRIEPHVGSYWEASTKYSQVKVRWERSLITACKAVSATKPATHIAKEDLEFDSHPIY